MIPARLFPITARVSGLLGLAKSMEDAAVEIREVAPEDRTPMPPVAIFPEHQEQIVAAIEGSSLPQEWNRLSGHEGINVASRRYLIRGALATPFGVFQMRQSILTSGQMSLSALGRANIARERKGLFAASQVSQRYFGHWLMDALPMTLLAESDETLFLPIQPAWLNETNGPAHATAILDALNINRTESDFVLFDELTILKDVGHNAHRRQRTGRIRDKLRASVVTKTTTQSRAPGVFISRGSTGIQRQIVNEAELIGALRARNFEVLSITDPIEEIWGKLYDTPRVVSLEGSHMSHALLLAAPNALYLTINPSDRFHLLYADYMSSVDGRLATVVAPRDGEGWRVDVDSVLRMLDREAP